MADMTTNSVAASAGFSISKAFDGAVEWLINLSKHSSRAKAVDALSAMTDEELAAKGTTRKDEVMLRLSRRLCLHLSWFDPHT